MPGGPFIYDCDPTNPRTRAHLSNWHLRNKLSALSASVNISFTHERQAILRIESQLTPAVANRIVPGISTVGTHDAKIFPGGDNGNVGFGGGRRLLRSARLN